MLFFFQAIFQRVTFELTLTSLQFCLMHRIFIPFILSRTNPDPHDTYADQKFKACCRNKASPTNIFFC